MTRAIAPPKSATVADAGRDRQFAQTLARGLELLSCFTPRDNQLANRDFVHRTGLDKATVSRLTHTLLQLGYLRHDRTQGKYRLGAAVLALGYPLLASMTLRQIVRPWIKELADEMHCMVGIAIRDRTNMVYMETFRSKKDDAPLIDIGASFPIMATASGRAWLARSAPAERDKVLNQIRVREPRHHAQHIAAVRQGLREFSQHGFTSGPGLVQSDRLAVAVPMAAPVNGEIVVFACAMPLRGRSPSLLQERAGARLITLVRSVEIAMGQA